MPFSGVLERCWRALTSWSEGTSDVRDRVGRTECPSTHMQRHCRANHLRRAQPNRGDRRAPSRPWRPPRVSAGLKLSPVLTAAIYRIVMLDDRQLTQTEAAYVIRDAPSQISLVVTSKLRGFSVERLVRMLVRRPRADPLP
jgi:predicted XRE-type DNA-binding protein